VRKREDKTDTARAHKKSEQKINNQIEILPLEKPK
jgi:hypothetical protein